jgi:hypothetical protein
MPAADTSPGSTDEALPTLDGQMATSRLTSLDTLFGGAQAFGATEQSSYNHRVALASE